jgi:hypothetical protein
MRWTALPDALWILLRAISLACEKYVRTLPDIEDYIRQKIQVMPLTD